MKLDRESDIEVIRQAAQLLEAENKRLVTKTVELQREVLRLKGLSPAEMQLRLAELERQLAQRNQMLFGRSTEKRPSGSSPAPAKKPQQGHGPHEQKALPIREEVFQLDEPDKACPQCGGALEEMKEQFEESEEVTVVERQFVLRKIKRQKYRCRCGGCVDTALGPEKLFPGARYSIDFAIEVAVQKYLDHLPLERQVRIMAREGLVVDSNTLWDQCNAMARLLEPTYLRQGQELRQNEPVLGADETRWPVSERHQEPKTWQVWGLVGPRSVHYEILDGRSAEEGATLLGDFAGVLMTDGYAVYEKLVRDKRAKFALAHCWAHVRRKLVDLEQTNPVEAKRGIDLIAELYAVERLCPSGPPGDDLRRRLRAERSRPLVEELRLFAKTTPALPESGLAKALGYMLACWPGLVRFLEDPRVPLDNNATERALRGVVIGRKNHYGSRSRRGTEVAAILYSLLESAKLAGVEPKAYLRTALLAAVRGERVALPHETPAVVA